MRLTTMSYLKDPQLVADIQNYFGVRLKKKAQQNGNNKHSEDNREFEITNKFWYYLFLFGTALGDEMFYSCFIPFWFWNVDGFVGRRVVLVWAIVMYIGQGIKDMLRWERPGPPVVKMQSKWALEYGMPSTHAMVAVSIPFSVLVFTTDRYQYSFPLGLSIAVLWCLLVCVSRLYLGMHTVLDILAGIALAVSLMFFLVPLVDNLDKNFLLTNSMAPLVVFTISVLMIVYYPNSKKWTPTRGDTTMILSVSVGIQIGSWLNYQTGILSSSELSKPYTILWPSFAMLGCILVRTILGFAGVLLTRQLSKKYAYSAICALLRVDEMDVKKSENTLQNKHKTIVELGCKYVTCAMIGFNSLYLLPHVFRMLRLERPTFYTEL